MIYPYVDSLLPRCGQELAEAVEGEASTDKGIDQRAPVRYGLVAALPQQLERGCSAEARSEGGGDGEGVRRRIAVSDRTQAAVWAVRKGLV